MGDLNYWKNYCNRRIDTLLPVLSVCRIPWCSTSGPAPPAAASRCSCVYHGCRGYIIGLSLCSLPGTDVPPEIKECQKNWDGDLEIHEFKFDFSLNFSLMSYVRIEFQLNRVELRLSWVWVKFKLSCSWLWVQFELSFCWVWVSLSWVWVSSNWVCLDFELSSSSVCIEFKLSLSWVQVEFALCLSWVWVEFDLSLSLRWIELSLSWVLVELGPSWVWVEFELSLSCVSLKWA